MPNCHEKIAVFVTRTVGERVLKSFNKITVEHYLRGIFKIWTSCLPSQRPKFIRILLTLL